MDVRLLGPHGDRCHRHWRGSHQPAAAAVALTPGASPGNLYDTPAIRAFTLTRRPRRAYAGDNRRPPATFCLRRTADSTADSGPSNRGRARARYGQTVETVL